MKVIIDTNSLLSLVRYYLPFDGQQVLFEFFKRKIADGEMIIIDKVLEQCKYNAKGLVLEKLNYLTDKEFLKENKIPYHTDSILAPAPSKFLRQLDNQFVNRILKNKLTDTEYEVLKERYMEDADMKLILLCLNLNQRKTEDIYIVTEETESSNDNKLFKKIPAICKELTLNTITLPELIKLYPELDFSFN
jgi:hypothetical protein